MGTVIRSSKAKRDLIDIYKYIADDNPAAAKRMIHKLDEAFSLLSESPYIGTRRFPNHPNVRGLPIDRYIVLYEPLEDESGIRLIRVFHGARDWHILIGEDIQ